MIKPGFFWNEELAKVPFETRLLFAGLWLLADRRGVLEDRPYKIKAQVFPYDDINLSPHIDKLVALGLVVRYDAGGRPGLFIPTFCKHQNPHKREAESDLPSPKPSNYAARPGPGRDEHRTSTGLAPLSPLTLNPSTFPPPTPPAGGEDHEPAEKPRVGAAQVRSILDTWNELTTPPIPRANSLSAKRRRTIKTRLGEPGFLEAWPDVCKRVEASSFCRGESDSGWIASLDALLRPGRWQEVLEGKYADKKQNATQGRTEALAREYEEMAKAYRKQGNEPAAKQAEAEIERLRA